MADDAAKSVNEDPEEGEVVDSDTANPLGDVDYDEAKSVSAFPDWIDEDFDDMLAAKVQLGSPTLITKIAYTRC
jgi:hypothetical protein